jgi:hypothetical protein
MSGFGRPRVRQQLAQLARRTVRTPYAAGYYTAVALRLPLSTQLRLLPMPAPLPVLWIETPSVERWTNSRRWTQARSPRFCYGGDWDLMLTQPRRSIFEPETVPERVDVHETIRDIFIEARPYQTTRQFRTMMRLLREQPGARPWGCGSDGEVHEYFARLERAFASMRERGWLTQHELGNHNAVDDEMRLYVTRDGVLCQGSGANHRIRMAEILGIRWLPFVLRGAHTAWVAGLCRESDLPPHEAVSDWVRSNPLTRASRPDTSTPHVGSKNAARGAADIS